jgi:hypothetical protein
MSRGYSPKARLFASSLLSGPGVTRRWRRYGSRAGVTGSLPHGTQTATELMHDLALGEAIGQQSSNGIAV